MLLTREKLAFCLSVKLFFNVLFTFCALWPQDIDMKLQNHQNAIQKSRQLDPLIQSPLSFSRRIQTFKKIRTAPKLSGFVASFCCQFSCLSFWATRIFRAFLNSSFPGLFKSALKLPLAQNQRHENWQQKDTTNPDNFGTVLMFESPGKWGFNKLDCNLVWWSEGVCLKVWWEDWL